MELVNIYTENLNFTKSKYTTYSHFYVFNYKYLQLDEGYDIETHLGHYNNYSYKDYTRRFIVALKDSKKQLANLHFKKTKTPQRKFYNKFHRWYKKNSRFTSVNAYPLWFLLVFFEVALSKVEAESLIKLGLIMVNGLAVKKPLYEVVLNDIIKMPYINFQNNLWIRKIKSVKSKSYSVIDK